jgi:hypothetical protein
MHVRLSGDPTHAAIVHSSPNGDARTYAFSVGFWASTDRRVAELSLIIFPLVLVRRGGDPDPLVIGRLERLCCAYVTRITTTYVHSAR